MIDLNSIDSSDMSNIYTEVELLKNINHPNIIRMIDVFQENSSLFIILELLKGGELFDRIVEKDHFSELEAAKTFLIVSDTIRYLHQLNIVHRDLKPENILYESNDENSIIKIIDFGTSRVWMSTNMMLSTFCGTNCYLPPEVLNGDKYSKPSDIWALGIILYIMLSGFFPFPDENSKLLEAINSKTIDFSDDIWKNISKEAKDWILCLLCHDSNKRIKIEDIRNHKWFDTINKQDIGNIGNLKSFISKNKLKKAQNAVYAIEAMKKKMNMKIFKNK